jgi:hypothetical protein
LQTSAYDRDVFAALAGGVRPPRIRLLLWAVLVRTDGGEAECSAAACRKNLCPFGLHAFQKKSKRGIKTPPEEIVKVKARLKEAEKHYADSGC